MTQSGPLSKNEPLSLLLPGRLVSQRGDLVGCLWLEIKRVSGREGEEMQQKYEGDVGDPLRRRVNRKFTQ